MPTGKCKNCGMTACVSVLCKQHLSKTAVTSAGKKTIAKKPAAKPAAKPAGITKAKAPAKAKVPANKAVEKQPDKNTVCWVLSSGEDSPTDVIGVFSKWSPLVKKAQAIMKKKGVTLRVVDYEDAGAINTITPEPFPAVLLNQPCGVCIAVTESSYDNGESSCFALFVQQTKAQ